MSGLKAQFTGIELYFEDLERARTFYMETLGLAVSDEQVGHHVKFDSAAGFICLERKGVESLSLKGQGRAFF